MKDKIMLSHITAVLALVNFRILIYEVIYSSENVKKYERSNYKKKQHPVLVHVFLVDYSFYTAIYFCVLFMLVLQ